MILGTHLADIKAKSAAHTKYLDSRRRTNRVGQISRPPAPSDLTQSLEIGHQQPLSKSLDELTQSLPAGYAYHRQQTMPATFSPYSISTEHELESSFGQLSTVSQSVTSEVASGVGYVQDQQQRVITPSDVRQFEKISEVNSLKEETVPSSPRSMDLQRREDALPSIGSEIVSPVPAAIPVTNPIPSPTAARSLSPKRSPEQWIIRTLADMYICEGEEEQIRYRRYFWNLFTISIFYGLPAFQLILTYQQLLHVTGNQDICYYNYLCTRQLGVLR